MTASLAPQTISTESIEQMTDSIDVEALYREFGPMVLRRCRSLLQHEEDAVEAMQQTFVKVLENADTLDDRAPSSLLWTIATRICLNILRARKSRPESGADRELVYRIAELPTAERLTTVRGLLQKLFGAHDDRTREIAVMHFVDGMTHQQVADVVGLSVSGVRWKLRQLRETLEVLES